MAEKENAHLHDGHRARVKRQLLDGQFDNKTPSHILLETLLYYSIPRKDTNETAHILLNRFKTLDGVINAPAGELLSVNGITENTVALFRLFTEISKRIQTEDIDASNCIFTHEQLGEYVMHHFYGCKSERVGVIYLKSNHQIIGFEFVGEGDFCSVALDTRKIVKYAVTSDTAYIILAHNHPSGVALPSRRDIEVTRGLVETMSHLGVRVVDHVIVADNDYISMQQSAEYKNIF